MKVILTLNSVQFGIFKKAIELMVLVRRGDTTAIVSPLAGKAFDREIAYGVCYQIKKIVYPDLTHYGRYCITDEQIGKYGKYAVSLLQKMPDTCETETCDIEMDMHEAYTAVEALDVYSRIKMAQIWMVRDLFYHTHNKDLDQVDKLLEELAKITFPEFRGRGPGCCYGIGQEPVGDGTEAFDIQQVIRHALAWKRQPQGGITVDFGEPMKWGSEPLPIIRIEDD